MRDAPRRAGTARRTRRWRGRSGDRRSQQRCRWRRPVCRAQPRDGLLARHVACTDRRRCAQCREAVRAGAGAVAGGGIAAAAGVAVAAVRGARAGVLRAGDGLGGLGYSAVRGRCRVHLMRMRLVEMRRSGVHHVSMSVRRRGSDGMSRPAQHAAGEDEHQGDAQRGHGRDYRRGGVGSRGRVKRRRSRRWALGLEDGAGSGRRVRADRMGAIGCKPPGTGRRRTGCFEPGATFDAPSSAPQISHSTQRGWSTGQGCRNAEVSG